MPAPSSKARKDAVSRTPVTIKRVGIVNKRRGGRREQASSLFNKTDLSLVRER